MSMLTRRVVHPHLVSQIRLTVPRRFNSSPVSRPYRGGVGSHAVAGILGGLTVIGVGYTWYHFSNVKKAVDAAQRAKFFLQETKQSLLDKKNSNKALLYLRKVAKSYVAILPGADMFVDQAFDSVDEIVDAHAEEATAITNSAYAEIQEIMKNGGEEQSLAKAIRVMDVLKRRLGEIQALGVKVGGDTLGPLWDEFPEVRGKIGAELGELQNLAKDRGPDARRIWSDTQQQVKNVLAEGVNNETLKRAHSLIREKTSKLRGHQPTGDGDVDGKSDDGDDSRK